MKDFLYTNRLFVVGFLAMLILFGISFIDPNKHPGDSKLFIVVISFFVLALLYAALRIFIFQKIYLKWIPIRNQELKELASQFGFNFSDLIQGQKTPAFKEYPVNKIEGTISGHQVTISDMVKFKLDFFAPNWRQTVITLDGKNINKKISSSGFGGAIYLTPVKDLQNFLSEIQSNKVISDVNQLKSVKFSYSLLVWATIILLGIILQLINK